MLLQLQQCCPAAGATLHLKSSGTGKTCDDAYVEAAISQPLVVWCLRSHALKHTGVACRHSITLSTTGTPTGSATIPQHSLWDDVLLLQH
jgi:hypothetical protein